MKLSELMGKHNPNPDYEGFVTNDDLVLAVDISGKTDTAIDDYIVAQIGVAGLDAQMNPVMVEKQYIRSGQSSTKTGTQRTFKVTGDRYIGDEFQDYAFSHNVKYGTGQGVIVNYVYFNILNGKGEKGQASIIVNSDASGNAGESSGIDIDIKKTGAMPEEFIYTKPVSALSLEN